MRALFARRDFRLLFAGLLASMVGDSIMIIVLAIWVKELTGSSGAAGLTIFFIVAPSLAGPLLGWAVDRVRRRPFLIIANLASALALSPLLLVHDSDDVWLIYTVSVLYGVSFVMIPAALNGLLKELLEEELLLPANSTLQTVRESMRLFGPLAGAGLLTAFGGGSVAIIDAVSFCIAATCISLLSLREDKPAPPELHFAGEVAVGVKHVWHDAMLRPTLIALGAVLLAFGFLESLTFAVVQEFGRSPSFVGVVLTVQGIGAIIGGVLSARLVRRVGEINAIITAIAIMAVGLSLWMLPYLAAVLAGTAVFGLALPVLIVAFMTLLQRRTPSRIMGRVSTAADIILGAPQTLSIAVGAVLVGIVDYRLLVAVITASTVIGAAWLSLTTRSVRAAAAEPERSDVPDPPETYGAAALVQPAQAEHR